MLNMVVRNSKKLIRKMSKSDDIRIGRFFTKVDMARQMAACLSPIDKSVVHVLDPGAGTGILSAAVTEELCRRGGVTEIFLTCYENNPMFLPMLADNMERMRKRARHDYKVKVRISVINGDFLTWNHTTDERYDIAIINPPQELIDAASPAMQLYPEIITSATVSLSPLFILTARKLLLSGGQLVTVLPVSMASAVQLSPFRKVLFSSAPPDTLCLFTKQGARGEVLKKNFVVKCTADMTEPDMIRVFTADEATPSDFSEVTRPYTSVVRAEDAALTLLSGEDEQLILDFMHALPCTFDTFHLKVHTGLTLASRYPDALRDRPEPGAIPLIYPRCLRDGNVVFPLSGVKGQFIVPTIPSLKQPSKNILLIKRVPAKSDKRRIMCAPYLAGMSMSRYISTHNKLNYIDVDGNEQMDPPFLYGLHAFLSSEPMDRYIRIISKTTQLNARDLSSLPLPTATQLRAIGAKLMAVRIYKPEYCDRVVKSELFGVTKK